MRVAGSTAARHSRTSGGSSSPMERCWSRPDRPGVRLRPGWVQLADRAARRYRDIEVPPWIPIGVTGVVRRAERNSTVVAAEPGEVLMIPGELFAREWFRPYGQVELADVLVEIAREVGTDRSSGTDA